MKNSTKIGLLHLLVIYIFLLFFVVIIEIIERNFPGTLPFPWNFWDALIAIGTIGVVLVALIAPLIEKHQQRKILISQLTSNIKNELAINFDQLAYNSLNGRDFFLETTHLDSLLDSTHLVNLGASDGIFRQLRVFYTSAKWFNVRMSEFVNSYNTWIYKGEKTDKNEIWILIKKDAIKHMLLILWIAGQINFETEGEEAMTAINNFINSHTETLEYRVKTLRKALNNTWSKWEFPEDIPNDAAILKGRISKEGLCLNFLISKLNNIYKQSEDKILVTLDKGLRKLIIED